MVNAQGEDVVDGISTPQALTEADRKATGSSLPSMEVLMPDIYAELVDVRERLEHHYQDLQDMEFTVQQNKLWMLQTRTGKRTAKAALRIACDMVDDGMFDKSSAIMHIDAAQLDQLLHPTLDPEAERKLLGRGLPSSPGAATGHVAFTAEDAETRVANGERVVLVRVETSPEDINGMHVSEGILTTRGGMTSHAAVVARGMGIPCVSGASDLRVDCSAKGGSASNGGTYCRCCCAWQMVTICNHSVRTRYRYPTVQGQQITSVVSVRVASVTYAKTSCGLSRAVHN